MSNVLVKVKRGKVIMPDYDSFDSANEAFQYIAAAESKREELKKEKSVKQRLRTEKDCRYYESLKTAINHQQRFDLLSDMSMEALKKIAQSEHISIKGLRTKKAIVDTLLHVIEGRYDTLDKGEHVYIPDEFGLPTCGDDTPLNAARIQFNKKALNDIQHALNEDAKAQAITVEAVEKTQPKHEVKVLPEKISDTDDCSFSFSYTADKKEHNVSFSVKNCTVSEDCSDWQKKYFKTYFQFLNEEGKRCFVYYPFLDYVEFHRDFSSYYKWQNEGSRKRACEAQLRKVLPDLLKHFGYLDDNGDFIPDGNEAYRVLVYKDFKEGKIKYADDFSMPDNPFSNENDKDNPLSWQDSPQRTLALRLFHRLLSTQFTLLNTCRNDADRNARNKEIESIRKIIHSLFENIQHEVTSPNSENQPAFPQKTDETPKTETAHVVQSNRKNKKTPQERNIVTALDISSCGCENQILALLDPLKLNELKSLARELHISLVNLKHMNNKKRLAKYIAYRVILLRNIQQKEINSQTVKPEKRITSLQNFSVIEDEKTGQLSFCFA